MNNTGGGKIRAQHETGLAKLAMDAAGNNGKSAGSQRTINLRYQKELEKLLKQAAERRKTDRAVIEQRIENARDGRRRVRLFAIDENRAI